ncbi:MAG: potassium channel family protein [Acetobacteraceae bacterium]|nr:potassium channel family protein [Acetobacteraceae bacterium]
MGRRPIPGPARAAQPAAAPAGASPPGVAPAAAGLRPFVLLGCLVGFLLFAPFMPTSLIGQVILQLMVTTLILASAALRRSRWQVLLVATLTALWVAASWSAVLFRPPPWVEIAAHGLLIALLALALLATLRPVFGASRVEAATIAGAVSGYLLIALTWAAVYQEMAAFDPGAFSDGLTSRSWIEATYFSLVTITTVGFGDIVARSPVARIWSGLEAVTGNLYMAVLIARLVSEWRNERHSR